MPALQRRGHRVWAGVRTVSTAIELLGGDCEFVDLSNDEALAEALKRSDALVHLAGSPIVGTHWRNGKPSHYASRVALLERLHRFLPPTGAGGPQTVISASAVGIYGEGRGDQELSEATAAGSGPIASLCQAWEDAADLFQTGQRRVVKLRCGVVLGQEGGALLKLAQLARLGLSGRIGGGRQWVSWIHMNDLVALILQSIEDRLLSGAVNATSPNPCTQQTLSRAVAAAVSRPLQAPVPAVALRLRYGAAASVLTDSHRVLPVAATEARFDFKFPSLEAALDDCLGASAQSTVRRVKDSHHGNAWRLTDTMDVEAPLEEVSRFFANPHNLGAITPAWLSFQFLQIPDALTEGARLIYQIRIGGLPMRWVTRLTRWDLPLEFRDEQERGPYRVWNHSHSFERLSHGGTRIRDEVIFAARFGVFGRLAERLFVCNQVRRIFAYRRAVTARRFGTYEQSLRESSVA